ncbi:CPBP family intramembrane glutamic endopeptidase [Fructobacillus tropaeoli]|uniref:CPBP family intramembrane glutamic endopeptidase n=1 Tax=Fructobacillus tropaeoli TaxID=709323 RepID=UPI0019420889|nr:type II CAAX endopeptidase family protein [Fructobacillus tropaeoli]GIC69427.1 CPBP family intramembrane metalloprotease [Fructobacillus tropaeoli]
MKIIKKIFVLILLIAIVLVAGYISGSSYSLLSQSISVALYIFSISIAVFIVKAITKVKIFEKLNWYDVRIIIQNYILQMALLYLIRLISTKLEITTNYKNQENILQILQGLSAPILSIMLSFIILFGPILEEIVFRGYVMNIFERKKMGIFSVILSSLIFSYLHLHSFLITENNIIAFLSYFITGISLALTYRKTKKLTASIAQHMLANVIASIPIMIMI